VERNIIKLADFGKWMEKIKGYYDLYAPVRTTVVNFEKVEKVDEICLDFANTFLPPKVLFFPQSEELFTYSRDSKVIVVNPTADLEKERVLFGIRPCDLKALSILDFVFDGKFQDSHYVEKRRKTALIGVGCTEPQNTCFCSTFGINPISGEGSDIFLIDNGEYFTVKEINTEMGKSLFQLGNTYFKPENLDNREHKTVEMKRIEITKITDNIKKTGEYFWNSLSDPCLSCGICTYVCPTCHCFDVEDVEKKIDVVRFRTWDFCMNKDFTRMASGENPRMTKGERYRYRYFHKFVYFPKNYGVFGCVGCGRCVSHCPVNIDIRKVLEDIQE